VPLPIIGLFVGLFLGLAGVLEGFGAMLIVALCGIVGFVVVKAIEGDLDLSALTPNRSASRRS
jgi:hypothetical protein